MLACCRETDQAASLRALAKSHAVSVLTLRVDDAESVAALARELTNVSLDVLVNNAGVAGGALERRTATSVDFGAWAKAFALNTMGLVLLRSGTCSRT